MDYKNQFTLLCSANRFCMSEKLVDRKKNKILWIWIHVYVKKKLKFKKKLKWKIISVKRDLLVKKIVAPEEIVVFNLTTFAAYFPYFHLRGSGSVFRIWIQFVSGSTTMVLVLCTRMYYVLGCC